MLMKINWFTSTLYITSCQENRNVKTASSTDTLTIKKIRKKTQHVNIWDTVQYSNPSYQKLTNEWIQYIHALPQQWDKFFNTDDQEIKMVDHEVLQISQRSRYLQLH